MSSLSEILNVYSFELSGNPCWGFIIKDTREKNGTKMRSDHDPKTRLFTNNWKLGIYLLKSI